MTESELREAAVDLLHILHLSMNWEVWGSKRLKYWDIFQENVAGAAYTNALPRWLATLCNSMSIDAPGRNENDRARLDAILNLGADRALLKLLREETQYLVLRVRVLQQDKHAAAEVVRQSEMALDLDQEPTTEKETENA